MPAVLAPDLPALSTQADRLIGLGVHDWAGLTAAELRAAVVGDHRTGALLVIHPGLVRASALVPLLDFEGKSGFVVVDMPDVDDFSPIDQVQLPTDAIYVVEDVSRGDHLANWSPDEALVSITAAHRSPLTIGEGVHWLLQQPAALERGRCFMTIGSRLRKPNGAADARTPAIWISNGTGAGRTRPPQRAEGRLVLGRKPPHLAGFRLRGAPHRDAAMTALLGRHGTSTTLPVVRRSDSAVCAAGA